MDWSLRYAKTATEDEDGEIEVRQLFDLDEFVQGWRPRVPGARPGRPDRRRRGAVPTRPSRAVSPTAP